MRVSHFAKCPLDSTLEKKGSSIPEFQAKPLIRTDFFPEIISDIQATHPDSQNGQDRVIILRLGFLPKRAIAKATIRVQP